MLHEITDETITAIRNLTTIVTEQYNLDDPRTADEVIISQSVQELGKIVKQWDHEQTLWEFTNQII